MTVVLRETTLIDQVLTYAPPLFKSRALLAYGHGASGYGLQVGAPINQGTAQYGLYSEDEAAGMSGACGFSITSPGSLETGKSGFLTPSPTFYITGGGTVPEPRMELDHFGCGEVGLHAAGPASVKMAMFVLGGKTLETALGFGTVPGSGSQAITGVGFQPDLVIISTSGHTYTGGMPATPGAINMSYGAADADLNQFACCVGSNYLGGTSGNRTSRTVNDACLLQLKPSLMKANLTSMDADGFTLNFSSYSGLEYFWWIAIRDPGGQFKVGTATEGDSSFTPGFTPDAVMFANAGNIVYGTSEPGCALGFGGADSDGNQFAGWESAPAANFRSKWYWQTKAISMLRHPTGTPSGPTAEADISSWGASVGLNWTTVSANALKFGWVAMKTSEGPGFDGCGGFVPQIFRYLKGR